MSLGGCGTGCREAGTTICLCIQSCQPWHAPFELYTSIPQLSNPGKMSMGWEVASVAGIGEGRPLLPRTVCTSSVYCWLLGLNQLHTQVTSCIKARISEKYPISPSRSWAIKICTTVTFLLQKVGTSLFQVWIALFQWLVSVTPHQKGWIHWSLNTRITSSLQTSVAIYTVPASFSQGCFGCMQSPGHRTTMDRMLSVPMAQCPGRVTWMPSSPLDLQCCSMERPAHSFLLSQEGNFFVQFSQVSTSWVEGHW